VGGGGGGRAMQPGEEVSVGMMLKRRGTDSIGQKSENIGQGSPMYSSFLPKTLTNVEMSTGEKERGKQSAAIKG